MHIALITRVFVPGYGGLEGVQVNLARMLLRLGCRVTVFAEKWAEPVPEGMRMVPVAVAGNRLLHKAARFTQALQRLIHPEAFDCTLANTPYFPCDIHRAGGGINRFWYGLKPTVYGPVYRLINRLPKYTSALALERQIYNADNVRHQIANSRLVKRQMIDFYGYPENRISVIYNGIDLKTFDRRWRMENRARLREEMGLSPEKLVVLFVSNNHKRKGLASLVEAVRLAPLPDTLEVIVLGRGRKMNTRAPFRFVGYTDRIRDYYAAADGLILPTHYEPCANVVLEAMACALPVMTTALNGASEFIEHRQNGFILADGDDVSGIQQGLVHWVEHPVAAREMGLKGHASVCGLSWEACARQVYQLCVEAAEKR